LDGLRTIAIALVIASHGVDGFVRTAGITVGETQLFVFRSFGIKGVTLFFSISGFLITHLLIREQQANGMISLSSFYMRRMLRIFPAFYFYLLAVVTFATIVGRPIRPSNIALAGTFLNDYRIFFHVASSTSDLDGFLGHTWSLATEEQFYLVWPIVFVVWGLSRAKWVAGILILLMPLVRVLCYFLVPSGRAAMAFEAHDNLDRLMCGCLLALLSGDQRFEAVMRKFQSAIWPSICVAWIFLVQPVLEFRFGGTYSLVFGISIESLMWAFLIGWLIRNADSMAAAFLNLRPVAFIGSLSYSLYLWQQPFTQEANSTVTGRFPINLLCIIAAACFSYFVIERPFNVLRSRFRR